MGILLSRVQFRENPPRHAIFYIGFNAEVDHDFKTFYFLKVGESNDEIARLNSQRLKLLYSGDNYLGPQYAKAEDRLKSKGRKLYGNTRFGYKVPGHTECFGRFSSIEETLKAAEKLIEVCELHSQLWYKPGMSVPDFVKTSYAA
jgi:hypothetical protein